MLRNLTESLDSNDISALANAFTRYGWGGFLVQVIVGVIPAAIMIYTLLFSVPTPDEAQSALPLIQLFSTLDFVLLLFIMAWFIWYARIGSRIREAPYRLTIRGLHRVVWIGVAATTMAILFSMLVLLFEIGNVLFYFLSTPQAGIGVIRRWDAFERSVSAIDMMNLLSLILALGGEILALIFAQLLLFRTNQMTTNIVVRRRTQPSAA